MWLERWLERPGLRRDAGREHHGHQRQDLRGRAGTERGARGRGGRSGTSRTRRTSASAAPTTSRRRRRRFREIVALIEELIERELAYPAGGDVYFRVDRFPDYGVLSGRLDEDSVRNPSEEEEQTALRRARATSRSGRGTRRTRTRRGTRRGGAAAPAGTSSARRWPRSTSGPVFEIHGGGLDLVFPHHENEIAQSRGAGREFAQLWMHNGMLQLRRREDVEVARQRDHAPRRARRVGAGDAAHALPRSPLAQADRLLRRDAARGESAGGRFSRGVPKPVASRAARGTSSSRALDDDFNTPEALAVMHEWRDHDLLRRGLELFGLGSLAEEQEAPAELDELARRRAEARAGGDFDEADRLREEIEAAGLGGPRRGGRLRLPARPEVVTADQIYGRRAVREALRGPRAGARALGDRARALGAEPWLQENGGPRVQVKARPRAERGGRALATTRASSRASSRTGTRMPTSSPRSRARSSSASTA